MSVPKFSGTWLGSRLVTQVGCQHINRRCESGPSPSIRYRFARQRVPAATVFSVTDFNGIRQAAYQTFVFSSIRAVVFHPEVHPRPAPFLSRSMARSIQSPVGAISYSR